MSAVKICHGPSRNPDGPLADPRLSRRLAERILDAPADGPQMTMTSLEKLTRKMLALGAPWRLRRSKPRLISHRNRAFLASGWAQGADAEISPLQGEAFSLGEIPIVGAAGLQAVRLGDEHGAMLGIVRAARLVEIRIGAAEFPGRAI